MNILHMNGSGLYRRVHTLLWGRFTQGGWRGSVSVQWLCLRSFTTRWRHTLSLAELRDRTLWVERGFSIEGPSPQNYDEGWILMDCNQNGWSWSISWIFPTCGLIWTPCIIWVLSLFVCFKQLLSETLGIAVRKWGEIIALRSYLHFENFHILVSVLRYDSWKKLYFLSLEIFF